MKIGLLSAILPEKSFEEVIDIASNNGYKAVELCCWPKGLSSRRYAGVTHIDVDDLSTEKIEYYLDYAKKRNIEIMALGYYPNPLDHNEENGKFYIEHIKKTIKAANLMGVNRISTFIGKNQYLPEEENFKLFMKKWPDIVSYAEKMKVFIGIENCPMYFTKDEWPGGQNLASSPYNWRKIFNMIPSKYFGLSYDPSHLHFQGMDYIKPIKEFQERLFHIHIKDIEVHQDKINEFGILTHPLNYMTPKIPGKGGIDWKKFMRALEKINYQNCACIEIEDKDYENNESDVLKAVKESFQHIISL